MKLLIQSWFKNNSSQFSGQLSFDEPLFKHTYYRIGGPALVFAVPQTLNDLNWLAQGISVTQAPFFIIGQGSNILAFDEGYPGIIIRAHRLNFEIEAKIETLSSNEVVLRTGASVAISTLLRRASIEGWGGLEFLTGIPGSVGGAVAMNAGTHLGEVNSRLKKVEVHPLIQTGGKSSAPVTFQGNQLEFQYRKNLFLPRGSVVWAAEWRLEKKDPTEVKQVIDETLARRKKTQPIDYPSCGSVFKNPKSSGLSAWQVVDQLGLRGHQIGQAQFSEKHSNFIINLGGAKAEDVRALILLAKSRAQSEMGIILEEEVILLNHSSV
jgi:UDP-N-acetylmuramate dehydrogenase